MVERYPKKGIAIGIREIPIKEGLAVISGRIFFPKNNLIQCCKSCNLSSSSSSFGKGYGASSTLWNLSVSLHSKIPLYSKSNCHQHLGGFVPSTTFLTKGVIGRSNRLEIRSQIRDHTTIRITPDGILQVFINHIEGFVSGKRTTSSEGSIYSVWIGRIIVRGR